MAMLQPPLDALAIGTHAVGLKEFIWLSIGTIDVTTNDPYVFTASIVYNAAGNSGTLDLTILLTDQSPSASSGPCTIKTSMGDYDGTYTAANGGLSFAVSKGTVTLSSDGSYLYLNVPKALLTKPVPGSDPVQLRAERALK